MTHAISGSFNGIKLPTNTSMKYTSFKVGRYKVTFNGEGKRILKRMIPRGPYDSGYNDIPVGHGNFSVSLQAVLEVVPGVDEDKLYAMVKEVETLCKSL